MKNYITHDGKTVSSAEVRRASAEDHCWKCGKPLAIIRNKDAYDSIEECIADGLDPNKECGAACINCGAES